MSITAILIFEQDHKTLGPLVYDLHNYFSSKGLEHKIVLLHSGSNLKIKAIIKRLKQFAPHIINLEDKNPHSLIAIKKAAKKGAGKYALLFDSTHEIHVIELEKILNSRLEYDFYLGTCSHQEKDPPLKKLFGPDKRHKLLLFKKNLLKEIQDANVKNLDKTLKSKASKTHLFKISCF